MSASIQNVYYERKTATPRACYICHRPSTTVLATIKMEDFLYTCESHLADPGFASPIPTPAPASGPSADDIKKVISDYHAREARKGAKGEEDKAKAKDGEKSENKAKDEEKEKNKNREKEGTKLESDTTPGSAPTIPTSSTPPQPTHKKYSLHRHIFEMRKSELKKREMGVKAKEVSKGLPQVPRTAF